MSGLHACTAGGMSPIPGLGSKICTLSGAAKKKKSSSAPSPCFPGGSDGNESAHSAGDPGSIPGVGRSPWRRKWQPAPVFFPGEFPGQRSLVGYSPWCHKESDTTDQLTLSISFPSKEELNKALGEGPNASESEKAGATRHPAVKVQESSCRFKKGSRGVTGNAQ